MYEAWCAANGQPTFADPDDAERQLLRFLHSNRLEHTWAWGTCQNYASGIAQTYQRNGQPDPRGPTVAAWMLALKREQAGRRASPRTDAVGEGQILAATAQSDVTAQVARLRGVVAVAEAFGLDPTVYGTSLQRLARAAIRVRVEDCVLLDSEGRKHVLDRTRKPDFYDALVEAIDLAVDVELPLFDSNDSSDKPLTVMDSRKLRAAWDRASPRDSTSVLMGAHVWRETFAASTTADRLWWLRCVDVEYERRIQDLAYLLVGIQTAFRHRTMQCLTLGHVQSTSSGFVLELGPREHKGGLQSIAQGGRPGLLTKFVDHLESESQHCPPHCPACALDAQVALRRQRGASDADSLWVNKHGRPLSLGPATRRLQQLIQPASDSEGANQTIGTRSLRVTAATLARQMGMTPAQIAATVTNHASIATAEVYIRRIDPFSYQLTLPLV